MPRPTILPDPDVLRLDCLSVDADEVVLTVHVAAEAARCPVCGGLARRVHSRYTRHVADLPWQGVRARLRLRVRRFFCDAAACPRRVFAERRPTVVAAYGRRTARLDDWLRRIGFALGGRPGERLLRPMGPAVGRDALLAHIRSAPVEQPPPPRVLGMDDFALRRGRTYGTILVDLERRRVVDLLPDRTAATVAAWLAAHPGAEIITRDRGGAYADGARRGAPSAVQVADRFHLLANAGDALERVLTRHHAHLKAAADAVDCEGAPATLAAAAELTTAGACAEPTTRAARDRAARRDRRLARYEAVVALVADGWTHAAVADHLGIGRRTVGRYVRAGGFPERVHAPRRPSILAPYDRYLRARWDAGCHNARALFDEIATQGFTGSASLVRLYVRRWRSRPARRGLAAQRAERAGAARPRLPTRVLSPRQARWLLMRPLADLPPDERTYRTALLGCDDDLRAAHELTADFFALVRAQQPEALAAWLDRAAASRLPEFRAFAEHIRRDRAAVDAALRYAWSGGQTEGQINRLKSIKRSMFGRAAFDLLRRRVLHAA